MDQEAKKRFLVNMASVTAVVVLVWVASKFLLGYLLPFVIGGVLAFAVQRPARFVSSRLPLRSGTCAAILVAVLYIAVMGVIVLLVWQLIVQAAGLITALPVQLGGIAELMDKLSERISVMAQRLPPAISDAAMSAFDNAFSGLVSSLTAFFSRVAASFAGNLPKYLFSGTVTIVASCYIAKDFEQLVRFAKGLIRPETYRTIGVIKDIITGSILKFAWGYVILSFITFIELTAGFFILRVKYAVVIAAVTAFIDILPVLGSGTVLLPWAVLCFLSGNFSRGAGLCVLYIIIMIVRYFAEPRIIGGSIGINPLLTLAAIFVGLRLGGVGGMIILPVVCIVVIDYYKRQMEAEKNNKEPSHN